MQSIRDYKHQREIGIKKGGVAKVLFQEDMQTPSFIYDIFCVYENLLLIH